MPAVTLPRCHVASLSRRLVATIALALALAPAPASAQTVRTVSLLANDLAYDATRQRIYASVPSSVGIGGNTITVIDPATGAIGPSVFVGSEPGPLALSDDGQYLYVGLNGAPAVRRVDLQTFTATQQFGLGADPNFGPYHVEDIEVAPGQPLRVAVSRRRLGISPRHGGVAIFDNGVALPAVTQAHTGSNAIEFGATPDRLYGYNTETTESGFRRLSVTATGVSEVDVSPDLFDPFTRDMVFEAGRIYGSGGPVIDAESRTVLGTFTGVTVGGTPQVRPATDRGAVHFLTGSVLRTYHAQTFVPLGAPFTVPGAGDETRSLIRVGAAGLAFRTDGGQVFLLDVSVSPSPPTPTPSPITVTLALGGCSVCGTGASLVVTGVVSSTATVPVRVEVKAGVGLPDGSEVSLSPVGQRHFEVAIPAGASVPVEFIRVVMPPGTPPGNWTYEVTLLSPELGRTYARSVLAFVVP